MAQPSHDTDRDVDGPRSTHDKGQSAHTDTQDGAPVRPSEAPSIKPIAKASIHRICSGQVVLDLAGAVKELVENALDAGATNIEVRLRDHGKECVEVVDNGCGVRDGDLEMLTKKYATSKICDFTDLATLNSFGFRGEALSSLCALSELSVTTRTEGSDAGTKVTYDAEGGVQSRSVVARAVGTTVSVRDVFARLPVRHKELKRNIKREYGKLLHLLQAYALVTQDTRIVCSNQGVGKNANRTTVINTQGGGSLRANVANVFGAKTVQSMREVQLDLGEGCGGVLVGMVSKAAPGCGRGAGDRQFFFVNGRPVDLPKAARLLNETYRQFAQTTGAQYPCAVLDFRLPTDAYDVNVTPDKRKVLLHGEAALLSATRTALESIWSPSKYTYAVGQGGVDETDMDMSRGLVGGREIGEQTHERERALLLPPPMSSGLVGVKREREEDAVAESGRAVAVAVAVKREPTGEDDAPAPPAGPPAWESFGMGATGPDPTVEPSEERPPDTTRDFRASTGLNRSSSGANPDTQRALSNFGFTRVVDSVGIGGGWRFRAGVDDEEEDDDDDAEEDDDPNDGDYVAGTGTEPPRGDEGEEEEDRSEEEDRLEEERSRRRSAARRAPDDDTRDDDGRRHPAEAPPVTSETEERAETFVKPEPDEDEHMEDDEPMADDPRDEPGVSARPIVHHGAPLAFSLAALRDARRRGRRAQGASRRMDADTRGEPAGTHASESKYAAASFRVESESTADIVADEDASVDVRPDEIPTSTDGPGGDSSMELNEGGDAVATGELERVFHREDFRDLKVVGQFNLGFILCTLGDDLFIVDQHASDEIYNFERLQRTTTLNRQPLMVPKKLELTAAETQTVHRNMPTFLANGFGFCEIDQPPPTVKSLALNSVPFSKGTTFGADDVHELIGMLDQGEYALPARSQLTVGLSQAFGSQSQPGTKSGSEIVRPTRVRAMLAMRACRSSIMIGKALDAKTMRRVLDNLSELQAPWNCPHGRPTMRHLADLRKLRSRSADGVSAGTGRARGFGREKVKGGIGGW